MTVDIDTPRPGVALVTMDDPRRYNAVSASMISGLREAIADLRHTREVRAIVLTGSGKGFCAGADLSFDDDPFPDTDGRGQLWTWYRSQEHLAGLIVDVHECPKPVVAAVHGAAIGGGFALALACDIRIGTSTSKYSAPFIRVGLTGCDAGTSYLLPRVVGAGRASELLLTGRDVGAEEAERIGLVSRIVPEGEHVAAALDTAELIAGHTEFGVWMTKVGLWVNVDATGLRQAMELENRTQVLALFTGNVQEAGAAFVEGRASRWNDL